MGYLYSIRSWCASYYADQVTFYGEDRRVYADALLSAEASTPSLLPSSSLPLLAFRVDFVVAGIGVLSSLGQRVELFFGLYKRRFT